MWLIKLIDFTPIMFHDFNYFSTTMTGKRSQSNFWLCSEQTLKMTFHQIAQQNFVAFGIGPYDPVKKKYYNGYIFLYLFLCVLGITLTGVFVFFEAKTFQEYTEGIYIFAACILSPIAVGSIALHVKIFFEYLERCENVFDASKCVYLRFLWWLFC